MSTLSPGLPQTRFDSREITIPGCLTMLTRATGYLLVLAIHILLCHGGLHFSNCPNGCSSHGVCANSSSIGICQCFPSYTGTDCSLRVCPSSTAWVDVPSSDTAAHAQFTECSNMVGIAMKLFWRSALNTAALFVYREHVTGQLDSACAGWALKGQRVIRVSGLPCMKVAIAISIYKCMQHSISDVPSRDAHVVNTRGNQHHRRLQRQRSLRVIARGDGLPDVQHPIGLHAVHGVGRRQDTWLLVRVGMGRDRLRETPVPQGR
jgi:hypothetical protein